jgi:hypothetical protein
VIANDARQSRGRERVPDRALSITFRRLRIPTLAGGFDRLIWIRLPAKGRFIVDPLEQ